jgi:MATE family multidrug resistance protein
MTAAGIELKFIFRLAAPAAAISLLTYVMSTFTQIFVGHLGTFELAGFGLGNNFINNFSYGILLGMGSAVETLCGQAYGAKKFSMLSLYLQRSIILLTLTAVALTFVNIFTKSILILFGQSYEIANYAALYALGLIPQIFAYAVYFPTTKFLQSQSIVVPSVYISVATISWHVVLTWLAVTKAGLGLLGASLVLSISWWFMGIGQFVYILNSDRCKESWTGFSMEAFQGLWGFFKLSVASAFMFSLESFYQQILFLFVGMLPNPDIAVDSISICNTLLGWVTMIAYGFNAAASVRVGNELGARHPKAAAFSVVITTLVSSIISIIGATLALIFRHTIGYVFTNGEAVAEAVSDMSPLLAVLLILNGIQPVLCGKNIFDIPTMSKN